MNKLNIYYNNEKIKKIISSSPVNLKEIILTLPNGSYLVSLNYGANNKSRKYHRKYIIVKTDNDYEGFFTYDADSISYEWHKTKYTLFEKVNITSRIDMLIEPLYRSFYRIVLYTNNKELVKENEKYILLSNKELNINDEVYKMLRYCDYAIDTIKLNGLIVDRIKKDELDDGLNLVEVEVDIKGERYLVLNMLDKLFTK